LQFTNFRGTQPDISCKIFATFHLSNFSLHSAKLYIRGTKVDQNCKVQDENWKIRLLKQILSKILHPFFLHFLLIAAFRGTKSDIFIKSLQVINCQAFLCTL
jgi:hypothetical protein